MRCIKCGEPDIKTELCECCKEELDDIVRQIKDFNKELLPIYQSGVLDYIIQKVEG